MGPTSSGASSTDSGRARKHGRAIGGEVAGDERAERGDRGGHGGGHLGREAERVDQLQQQRDEPGGAGARGRGDDLALHPRGLVGARREDDLVLDRLQALRGAPRTRPTRRRPSRPTRAPLAPAGAGASGAAIGRGPRRAAIRRVEGGPFGGVEVVAHQLVGGELVGHPDVGRAGVGQELGRRRLGRRLAATWLVGADVVLAGRRLQRGLVLAGEHLLELPVADVVVCAHGAAPPCCLSGRTAAGRSPGWPTARPGDDGGRPRSPPRSGPGRSPCACCPRSSRRRPGRRLRRCRRGWPRRRR